MKTTQENRTDYYAAKYFELANCDQMKYQFKKVNVDGAIVPVLHVSGRNNNNASKIDVDLWPWANATTADLEKLPTDIKDFEFRIGVATFQNEKGEMVTRESEPKVMCYYVNGREVYFSGKKHAWNEDLGAYEPWTNDEPEDE